MSDKCFLDSVDPIAGSPSGYVDRLGLMRIKQRDLGRRRVIEAHAAYDCVKKGKPLPDFDTWNWTQADAIDQELGHAGLKCGVLGGYRVWDLVELTIPDLRQCAVLAEIFPGQPRALGLIEKVGVLASWSPDRATSWFPSIAAEKSLGDEEPFILRPALATEAPADWYVEDGSGRVIALLANQAAFSTLETVAFAYLGREPDETSSFMRAAPFKELLLRR